MPNLSQMTGVPRRALPIFYVLDTSGSMMGEKIERLNHAMEETTLALKQVAQHNGDAQLKVAVLTFDSKISWVQPAGPEDMEDFIWTDLGAGGMTCLGAALDELESKLHHDAFLTSSTGTLMPVIIFMTDGYPNDDYLKALERINRNKYFAKAVKIGFAIGEEADATVIAQVVGDAEAVIKTDDLGLFARLIRFVSVTSSTMASVSHTTASELKGSTVVSEVLKGEGPNVNVKPNIDKPDMSDPLPPTDGPEVSLTIDPNTIVWDDPEEW